MTDRAEAAAFEESRIRALGPHGAVVIEGFYPQGQALRAELLRFPGWKAFRLGAGANGSFQTGITTGHIQGRFPELGHCHGFARQMLAASAALAAAVGAEPATPPAIDFAGMAYGQGGHLKPHTDSTHERRVAFMLYLTPPEEGEWSVADGGAVVLFERDGQRTVLPPSFNRLAAFRVSDTSWHEVLPVLRRTTWTTARLALAGWIHA